MTARTTPPFRADHVGSYLRTPAITEARAKRDSGKISNAELKKVEDQEIPKVIKKQEDVGLKCTTDGEYRRMFWHFDFYDGLDNVGARARPRHPIPGRADQAEKHPRHRQDRFHQPSDAGPFQILEGQYESDAEDVHPIADGDAFPSRTGFGRQEDLCRPRCHLLGPLGRLPQGGEGVLRRRLPLPSVRRHRLGLSLLRRRDEEGEGSAA